MSSLFNKTSHDSGAPVMLNTCALPFSRSAVGFSICRRAMRVVLSIGIISFPVTIVFLGFKPTRMVCPGHLISTNPDQNDIFSYEFDVVRHIKFNC